MLKDQRALILLDESNDRVAWRNASPLQLLYQRWQIIGLRRHFTSKYSNPLRWVFTDKARSIIREHFRRLRKLPQSPGDVLGVTPETRQHRVFRFIHSKLLPQTPLPPASSRRFWAERDSESTALTCCRHSITSASRPIDRRATMRPRQRARRGHSPLITART